MTQKCHQTLWKFTAKELHTANDGGTVKYVTCDQVTRINFDNMVIFSWLFRHKLRGGRA
jgi:hypothetical protein